MEGASPKAQAENFSHRYSHLCESNTIEEWYRTFCQFDRDGSGDVDLKEVGLMFRQLGQTPTEAEMLAMIEAVDADGSGTIDFEEFCLMMLRMKRHGAMPAWLSALFIDLHPDDIGKALANGVAPPPAAPRSVAVRGVYYLTSPQRGGTAVKAAIAASTPGKDESKPGPGFVANPPPGEAITREHLLIVSDLLPASKSCVSLSLAGHGPLMGPFVAGEVARGLVRLNRTLTSLDMTGCNVGDEGAAEFAEAIKVNSTLTSLSLGANNIGKEGGNALLEALRSPPAPPIDAAQPKGRKKSSDLERMSDRMVVHGLRELNLEGNAIGEELFDAIQQQLLLKNLPRLFASCLKGCGKDDAGASKKNRSSPSPQPPAEPPSLLAAPVNATPEPSVRLRQEWLSELHAAALQLELLHAGVRSLELHECTRFAGAGLTGLLAPMATPVSPLATLMYLKLSGCHIDDGAVAALVSAIGRGDLRTLHSLLLDHNTISLGYTSAAGAAAAEGGTSSLSLTGANPVGVEFGRALTQLPELIEVDLSSNANVTDPFAARFIGALLVAGSALRSVHLGATKAGDACADAVAAAWSLQPPIALRCLCLSSLVSDTGARALAAALPRATALRELLLGDKISSNGVVALTDVWKDRAACASCQLSSLVLGGEVRSGVLLRNAIDAEAIEALADLPRSHASLTDLRLSGNDRIGAEACVRLLACLEGSSAKRCMLRTLHIDNCGLTKEHATAFLEALDHVWVLTALKADNDATFAAAAGSKPGTPGSPGSRGGLLGAMHGESASSGKRSSIKFGAPAAGAPTGGGGEVARVFTLQQRLSMSKILEENRTMGPRRVENWRLSRSLEEVAWVFSKLCHNVPKPIVDAGLSAWTGTECAHFVRNLGLEQYAESFEFNLRGPMLRSLVMPQLAQLGVRNFSHQKRIMEGVRDLLGAFERKDRVAKAQSAWSNLLTGKAGTPPHTEDLAEMHAYGDSKPTTATGPHHHTPERKPLALGGRAVTEPARHSMKGAAAATDAAASPPLAPLVSGSAEAKAKRTGTALYTMQSSPASLPVDLRLPRIASLKHHSTFGHEATRDYKPRSLPKPSVVMPALGGALGGSLVEQAQWKELAISYGLHLVPDTRDLLHDNLQSVLRDLPPPPPPPKAHPDLDEELALVKQKQHPTRQPTDLGTSPSLPMLSPGRPGARNWVTFLHGAPVKAGTKPPPVARAG